MQKPDITGRISNLMGERKISKYRLAKDCKIPYSSLQDMLNNKAQWKASYVESIALYLNVTSDYIITGRDSKDVVQQLKEEITKLQKINNSLKKELAKYNRVKKLIEED